MTIPVIEPIFDRIGAARNRVVEHTPGPNPESSRVDWRADMDSTCRRSTESRMAYTVDENGCHVWQKAKNSRGYGVIWHDGKVRLAHRVAFYLARGRWPHDGLVVDHICSNKACVNATHLRELTNSQNIRRAFPRGDEATEKRRAAWRRADAKRRGTYTYTEGR